MTTFPEYLALQERRRLVPLVAGLALVAAVAIVLLFAMKRDRDRWRALAVDCSGKIDQVIRLEGQKAAAP